jgi:hypothetical protein
MVLLATACTTIAFGSGVVELVDNADEADLRDQIEYGVAEIRSVMGPTRYPRIDDALRSESSLVLLKRDRQRWVEVGREPLNGDVDTWVRIERSVIIREVDRDGISCTRWRLGSLA